MKTISMIGNAHLDPVWLWQWQEGYHEVKATFQAALDRLNESGRVQLDEERKAAMVSNLLVVLCGNREAQPIVNSGSLY